MDGEATVEQLGDRLTLALGKTRDALAERVAQEVALGTVEHGPDETLEPKAGRVEKRVNLVDGVGPVPGVEQEIHDPRRAVRAEIQELALQIGDLEEMPGRHGVQRLLREGHALRQRLTVAQPPHQLLDLVDRHAAELSVEQDPEAAISGQSVRERAKARRGIVEMMEDARAHDVVEEPEPRQIEERRGDELDIPQAADRGAAAGDLERRRRLVDRDDGRSGGLHRHVDGGVSRPAARVEEAKVVDPSSTAPEEPVDADEVSEVTREEPALLVVRVPGRKRTLAVLLRDRLVGGVPHELAAVPLARPATRPRSLQCRARTSPRRSPHCP